eukprot:12919853-Prorocentrum_lima.AAC.1
MKPSRNSTYLVGVFVVFATSSANAQNVCTLALDAARLAATRCHARDDPLLGPTLAVDLPRGGGAH